MPSAKACHESQRPVVSRPTPALPATRSFFSSAYYREMFLEHRHELELLVDLSAAQIVDRQSTLMA
jgi:hypothetical protein